MCKTSEIMNEREWGLEDLREAASTLIKFLNDNLHPHATAIVTPTSVEVVEGIACVQDINEFIKD